jgi:uroporphyrinogen decarboxylase
MASIGADIVSLDWTVTIPEARARFGEHQRGIQGNLDPAVLFAPHDVIKRRTEDILAQGMGRHHVMNLGHGIEADTPEENAKFFVDTVKAFKFSSNPAVAV